MTSLIDDILMISRLESKDAEVTLSKVNLKSVMDEVLESLTPQAASCKVEISGSCGNVILQASLQQMREPGAGSTFFVEIPMSGINKM